MKEPIQGLFAVYVAEYPDEGSALVEAPDASEAIQISRRSEPVACYGPWAGEPADALTAEAMTPEAMAKRIANEEADLSGTLEGRWLANVACGQAMEIEALREEIRRARSGEEQAGRERDEAVEQWHKDQARIDALTNDTIDLSLEVDEWREHFDDVLCGFAFDLGGRTRIGFVPCAHCGWRSEIVPESEINALIREHIKTCPKHPMRALEAERDEARRERWMADKERDAARMLAREVASELGEVGAEKLKAECERDVARAEVARLKAQIEKMEAEMSTMKPDLGWDDNDLK